MTHPNHQTNGASLEDCHTNFFALTELYGIKWRKLVWVESIGSCGGVCACGEGDEPCAPLADPVISSYARCLAGDILCVWRRAPDRDPEHHNQHNSHNPHNPHQPLRAPKELWIFWYGEEPDLSGLVAPELITSQGDQGSWETGLSYECRSLLFKALHNLIERCLLSRDFVRLGKWFVQPYDGDEDDVGKSPWHLSFSFAFFLHGESTVCASVDVRQHPPVRTLTPKRRAQHDKVILAPFGLEGTLTGREWPESDPATARLLDSWRHLYPLEHGCGAVEVICGGVRLRYPVPYALATELVSAPRAAPAAPALAPRCLTALTAHHPHQTLEVCYSDVSPHKGEDFVDPTRKTSCSCAKWRRRRPPRTPRPPPFHRRAPPPPARQARRHTDTHPAVGAGAAACSPGSCGGGSPAAPVSAPSSAGAPPPSHSPHHTALPSHQGACVPTTLHTPAPTPDPHAPTTPAPPSHPAKPYAQGESPTGGTGGASGPGSGGWWREVSARPVLPGAERRLDPLEDEHNLHMLYDYTTVHAWLEHPVKRFKSEEKRFREELALGTAGGDLYAGHEHTSMPAMPDHNHLAIKQEKQEPEDVKEYKNLFTSDGLCPTLKDLDQIFDNSDDGGVSGDETVRLLQVQTPPDSNKSVDESRCVARCVRPEELSKMFPTPPSMEAHAQPSPGFSLPDDATPTHNHLHLHHAHHPHPGSPPIEPIEDWSYVFKPPTVYKYVGSSKYAPLATLPSQLLPPATLPPHAVYRPRWLDAKTRDADATADTTHRTTGTKRSLSPVSEPRAESRTCAISPASVAPSPAPPPPATATGPTRAPALACPLLVNVLLADTLLNIFRDHNFDSCTLCVCTAGPKMVGSIRGADAAMYLSGLGGGSGGGMGDLGPGSPPGEEDPARCTCGFSAVVNRRLSHKAGLFYEDEMEITGMAEEPDLLGGRPGLSGVAGAVAAQCAAPAGGDASALARAARLAADQHKPDDLSLNQLEYSDGGAVATRALRAAVAVVASGAVGGVGAIHRWPFIGARAPRSTRDVVRLMRRLRPLLQDAIQKRCSGARMWDGVTGPLTWRQFHRLAGRGNEDLCEPQPVPPLLVGHDRDWVSLSPYALRHWDRLALEPYSYTRDVAYLVLAPHSDLLTDPLKTFFRELSTAYESCRLGRHQPISRIAKDGLVRTTPSEHRDGNCDEWTGDLPPGRLGDYIRAYAETLRTTIVPQLSALTIDRTLFESENKTVQVERPSPSPMRPPSTPDHPPTPNSQSDQESESAGASGCGGNSSSGGLSSGGGSGAWDSEEGCGTALVVYVVEPPATHAHRALALHALLRLAAQTYNNLQHHNPLIKIISLEGVWEWWGGGGCGGGRGARALAFSVFGGARPLLAHAPTGKSLTGFGTAAQDNLFITAKDEKNRAPYKLFSPAWVLAPGRPGREVSETWGQGCSEGGAVLFVSYCLSHDQRWLLAAATDARGELLDTAAINIHVPQRVRRRRRGPARRLGLTKLMDFTLGVMSQTAQPWRLVVGRLGRIGHGELKGWSWLLSRKNLVRSSSVLRGVCGACDSRYPSAAPCILSACLVSTEPEPTMRLMADRFTPDERFSQHSMHSHLHTPRDVTATHILVFPTSATTQSAPMSYEARENGEGNDMMFLDMDMVEEDMGEENMTDLFIGDMPDMFSMWPQNSPRASPRRNDDDGDGSPARHPPHHHTYHHHDDSAQEQVGNVLQQPLALGYLVSTAPLGAVPEWWRGGGGDGGSGAGGGSEQCPAFLKSALHLHAGNVQAADDFASLMQRRDHNAHPLDSTTTTDVLRYVLEGYNALSWLALDDSTHDRRSCLPLHVQALMQLYHTAAALG